jgi:SAM-dependent methyltransferase
MVTGAARTSLQEQHYGRDVDYTHGSPHLSDAVLRQRLQGRLLGVLGDLSDRGLPLRVLEIGAGHGGYTEPALAAGAAVTAVDMSVASLDRLRERYGTNPSLSTVHSSDGSLSAVEGDDYTLLLCVSVLHHIPDYVAFVREALTHLSRGASVLTLQDPLWYPRLPRGVHTLDRASYGLWRIRQGDLRRGVGSAVRRARGRLREDLESDMVEYHVLRQGVDEQALLDELRPTFDRVELVTYWSNQLPSAASLAQRCGARNSFGVVAEGFRTT